VIYIGNRHTSGIASFSESIIAAWFFGIDEAADAAGVALLSNVGIGAIGMLAECVSHHCNRAGPIAPVIARGD
jgi:hypothetical protein